MKKLVLSVLSLGLFITATAQNYWSARTDGRNITTDKAVARLSFPTQFKLYDVTEAPLRQQLFSVAGNATNHSTIISLPNADGAMEQFEVYEASNFEPALQARFPEIRAYSGRGLTDPGSLLKLSLSPQGIQTMVMRKDGVNEFIEPYSADHRVYAVFRASGQRNQLPWRCNTPEDVLSTGLNEQINNNIMARSGGDLKTMRLAQSVTAEYSNFFGATSAAQVSLVLAAVNATMTRCNGVYEKDLALHLNLIANTTNVFYYTPSSDPYSPASSGAGGAWNGELQSTLTSVIGEANYDVGHLFGASGGGGNAGCIGCVCTNNQKGSGFTSPADGIPQGDNFDIDYVVHEIGHQLGANHTFSMSNEQTGVNKEPGSGITIMGYAGITGQDLAPHSIAYYHQASIAQIQANLATKTCPVTQSITATNSTPVVNAGANYTIPISTPFALTGSATDANPGDVLTYSWEQSDNASTSQTGAASVASATKASGPNWISFAPTTSPIRLFPKLSTILAGQNVSGPLSGGDAGANTEALSSVSRTLNFRLTVRDNAPYSSTAPVSVGQTQFDDMVVTVTNTSGPFSVTAPNTAVSWAGNSSQTITWAVANTTASPVSCANVKISLSTDGGNNFTTLVASTANDGSEVVTIPNTPSTTARVKIEAVGNIFFDISNTNFTITTGSGCATPSGLASSGVTTTAATVSWSAVSGANSYDVDYKLNSSGTWTNAATGTTSLSVNLGSLASGSLYDWRVRANCSSGSGSYAQAQFTTQAAPGCGTAFEPNESIAAAATISAGVSNQAAITTSTDNDYFKIVTTGNANITFTLAGPSGVDFDMIAYNSGGTQIGSSTSSSANESISLPNQPAGTYYVRIFGYNGATSATCYTITATVTPITGCSSSYDVSTNGSASGAATIPFNTDIKGLISPSGDNDYYRITVATGANLTITLGTLPADYDIRLYSSDGTTQLAISQNGGTSSETIAGFYTAGTYYLRVYGYNNANNATNCYTLRVANGAVNKGNGLIVNNKISAFPNPVTDNVTIRINDLQSKATIRLFNRDGRLVLQQTTSSNATSIDMSKMAAGVYLVKVLNGETESTMKIVKQ